MRGAFRLCCRRAHRLVLILALAGVGGNALARDLVVGGSPWPPYDGEDLPQKGMSNALISTALERAGYRLSYVFDTWPRVLEGARLGVYDVLPAVWYTKDRARDLAFSKPYLASDVRFIKRKDRKIAFNSLADLEGLMIGIVKDYAYGEQFAQAPGLIRVNANYIVQNLLKVVQRQVDLTLGDERTLTYALTLYMPESIKELEFLPKPLEHRDVHIAVSKATADYRAIVKDFDKAIAAMKADGSYQKLVSDYEKLIATPKGP
jgi:polar amino acid transport system substrate-binding protein